MNGFKCSDQRGSVDRRYRFLAYPNGQSKFHTYLSNKLFPNAMLNNIQRAFKIKLYFIEFQDRNFAYIQK